MFFLFKQFKCRNNNGEKLRPHYNRNLEHFRLNQHRFKRFQKFTPKMGSKSMNFLKNFLDYPRQLKKIK